jgi:hypothetical protein
MKRKRRDSCLALYYGNQKPESEDENQKLKHRLQTSLSFTQLDSTQTRTRQVVKAKNLSWLGI